MILNTDEINNRLTSPLNLINRLNNVSSGKSTGMELFIPRPTVEIDDEQSKSEPLTDEAQVEDLIDEKKIKLGLVKQKALDVLHDSLSQLNGRLGEISKVKDLSSIARDMKVILTEEESVNKNNQNIIIYKPVVNDISKYDTLVVME